MITVVNVSKLLIQGILMFGQKKISEDNELSMVKKLAELIAAKCSIDNVEWRLSNLGMSIILDDNAFVNGGRQNERPIKYLLAAGALKHTEQTKGYEHVPYCTSSVCTLNMEQCKTAIDAFKALPDPGPKESKSQISKAC